MIISHKHRFIFIKNRKVGGTSIEKALQKICGPHDVLTPDHIHDSEEDELAPEARNYEGRFNPLPEILQCRSSMEATRILRDFARRPRFYNHIRASSIRARIGRRIWNDYYKFCFERNPWDKAISFYFWRHRHRPAELDVNAYVMNDRGWETVDQRFPVDWTRYTIADRMAVDDVYDFSDLVDGLTAALKKAGVPQGIRERVSLPNLKSHFRDRKRPQVLNLQASEKIRRVFAREIDAFGYTPPWDS